MEHVVTLIDKAAKMCGSQNALAERLGFSKGTLSDMRHGRKAISPATAAELADIAGEDARQAAIDAVIESARGTRREGVLREILGKALVAGVAGVLVFSYSEESISATAHPQNDSCIGVQLIHRIYQKLRDLFQRSMGDCTDVHRALAFG